MILGSSCDNPFGKDAVTERVSPLSRLPVQETAQKKVLQVPDSVAHRKCFLAIQNQVILVELKGKLGSGQAISREEEEGLKPSLALHSP